METKRNRYTSRRLTAACLLAVAFVVALAASSALAQIEPAPKKGTSGAQKRPQQNRRSPRKAPNRPRGRKKTPRPTPTKGKKPDSKPATKSAAPKSASPASKTGLDAGKKTTPKKQGAPVPPAGEDFGIDPEVQKKIDDMFKARGQTPPSEAIRRRGGGAPTRGATPAKSGNAPRKATPNRPGSAPPTGRGAAEDPSLLLDIAPAEDMTPPEDRMYGFAIKNGTYATLVEGFARQTGLGVIGNAPIGPVTFVTTEKLTFGQALGRIRMILFNFKAHEPYWLYRTPTHLQIVRVTDFYRILPLERMYPSVEAFRAAKLPGDELALMVYTPKAGSVANLNQLRDWLPDYVRIAPLGDQNRLTIFGLVSDIEKYLDLIKLFPSEGDDPRIIERIEIEFVTPSEAMNKLLTIMPQDGAVAATGRPTTRRGGGGRTDSSSLQNITEPPVTIVPDDAQGVLIVRAMQHKIDKIKQVLRFIDVDVSAENPPPAIIPVEHADASDIIPVVQQLISASSSPGGAVVPVKRSRRPAKGKSSAAAAVVTADSVTLLAHPAKNAVIVFASNEEAFADVRRFVKMLDISGDVGWTRIALKHAEAATVKTALEEMLPTSTGKGAKKESAGHQFVLDPSGDGLWYTGPEETLKKINDIIAIIDIQQEPVSLHSIRLVYRKPSFVSDLIKQREGLGEGPKISKADSGGKKQRRPATSRGKSTPTSSGNFIADDDAMTLLALCSDSKWDEYLAFIKTVDVPTDVGEPFERLAVKHIDAEKAADELSRIIGTNTFESSIRMVAANGSILILGANPQDIDRIKIFLTEIDKPSQIEKRTYKIRFAQPGEIKDMIETLVGNAPVSKRSGRAKKRGGDGKGKGVSSNKSLSMVGGSLASSEMTIIEYGKKLIIRATPDQHDEIDSLIAEFDVRDGQPELKVYDDFPPGADIEGITATIRSVLTGSKQPKRTARRPKDAATGASVSEGPQFIPQPSSGRLIVIAEPALFPEIERLLDVLRVGSAELEIIVAIIPVEHSDAEELVEQIEPILELKVKNLIDTGELGSHGDNPVASKAKAKLRGRISKATSDRYHINADTDRDQIVVAAPQVIVDEIRALVQEFDKSTGKGETVFRTVSLTNATPGEMIKALRELTGKTTIGRLNRTKQGGVAASATSPSGESLTILEAPGGGAVILRGLEDDVAQAEVWIGKLDALSSPDRDIKVYEIKTADITKLFDLIINVVETPARTGAARAARMPARTRNETEDDADTFSTSKSYSSQDVYIQADLIGRTMLVAATPSKAGRIDALINQFETDEELQVGVAESVPVPKFIYDLEYVDSLDASWELEGVFTTLWEPQDQVPQVEAALFGDFLVVRYPDESRFDEMREMIRKYVDVPDPETLKTVIRSLSLPENVKPSDVVHLIQASLPNAKLQIEDLTPAKEETYTVEEVLPPKSGGARPCVLPAAFHAATNELLLSITAQTQDAPKGKGTGAGKNKKKPAAGQAKKATPPAPKRATNKDADSMIRDAVAPIIKEKKVKKRTTNQEQRKENHSPSTKMPEGQLIKLRPNDIDGTLIFEGPEGLLPDIKAMLEEMKEEVENLPVAPDIRIYRVRYIDVYSAMDIINEMFNATRQQIQQAANAQRQAQRQQQAAQRQQQQQKNKKGQEAEDPRAKRGQQQRGQQPATVQLPPTTVRVYPNPRDRTLILRADASQYPQIRKLLATIDQPKPIDSFMRTYPLKNLNAEEVEEMLKDMLGLNAAAQRRGRSTRPRAGANRKGGSAASASSGGGGAQLPETILQSTVSGTNQLEVDPGDIKLFSSEMTNSIMVMAPTAALDYIGKIIEELDRKDRLPGRMTKYYTLKHAEPSEVVEYIASHFGTEGGKGGGKSGEGITRIGDSPNAPTIIGYPRLNQITVIANQAQIDEIEPIIKRLDVPGTELATETVTLQFANPEDVAESINLIFEDRQKALQKLEGKVSVSPFEYTVVVTPDVHTGQIIVQASETNMALIMARVALLDTESATSLATEIRTYPIKFADPNAVVTIINQWAKSRTQSSGSARTIRASDTVLATAEPTTQMVVVVASDENHIIVADLIKRLDDEKFATQLRKRQVLRLKHASAAEVAGQLTQVFKNAVRRQRSDRGPTFVADPKTNFIIADVNDEELVEITELLGKIDIVPPLEGERTTEVYPLRFADPGSLNAVVLNMFRWDVRSQPSPAEQVTSAVEGATQSLIVTASTKNHVRIREFIEKVDVESNMGKDLQLYKLKKANAAEVAETLQKAYRGRKSTRRGDEPVQITPEPSTNSLLIFANATEMAELGALIKSIDVEPSGQDVRVVDLKYADADALAKTLGDLYGKKSKSSSQGTIITAISSSRALVIKTNPAEFDRIQATIAELDTEDSAAGGEVRMVTLLYADASEILSALEKYLAKKGKARGELSGDVRLSAMNSSNSVMVAGALEEVERLEVIIKAMDTAGEKGSVPQIIPVEYANVGMIVSSLQEIFKNTKGGGGKNYQPPVIVADEMGNNLIVRAAPKDMQSIEDLVAKIDTKDKKDQTPYKIISLPAGMNPFDTAMMVEQTINETQRQRSLNLKNAKVANITVTSDRRTNSITLSGSATLFADAEAYVKQLQEMGPPGGTATRVVKVRNVAINDIQRLIDQLTQQGSSGGGSRGSARRGGSGGRRSGNSARRGGGQRRSNNPARRGGGNNRRGRRP